MNEQKFSFIFWPATFSSLVLLCIFSLYQLDKIRVMAYEREIQVLSSNGELSFLKGFQKFEKFFVAKGRSLNFTSDFENIAQILSNSYSFLSDVYIYNITNDDTAVLIEREDNSPTLNHLDIKTNTAFYPLIEASKIYGSNPIYGSMITFDETNLIPMSIYLDHSPKSKLVLIGFIDVNLLTEHQSEDGDFRFYLYDDDEKLKMKEKTLQIGNFFFNKLNLDVAVVPSNEEDISNFVTENLFLIIPIICIPIILFLLLWLETARRKKLEFKLSEQISISEQNSKFIFLGEITASIAHEINQPLAALSLYSASLQKKIKSNTAKINELEQITDSIQKCANKAGQIMHSTLNLATAKNAQQEKLSLKSIFDDLLPILELQSRTASIKINLSVASNLKVFCNRVALEQVILNLCKNAFDEIKKLDEIQRTLDIKAYSVGPQNEKNSTSRIEFLNHLSEETNDIDVNRIFSPFSSNKQNGLGLGLAISRNLLEKNGGKLHASKVEPNKIAFTVTLKN